MAGWDQARMGPAVVRGGRREHAAAKVPDTPDVAAPPGRHQPVPTGQSGSEPLSVSEEDRILGALRQMREMVEKNCENVGEHFAHEALRIHHGEAPERGIYGDVSARDREMLHDEGVEFHAIPWVSKTDS